MSLKSERRRLDTHIARTDRAISRALLSVSVQTSEDPRDAEADAEKFIAQLRRAILATSPRVRQGVVSAAELGSEATIRLASDQLRPAR